MDVLNYFFMGGFEGFCLQMRVCLSTRTPLKPTSLSVLFRVLFIMASLLLP